MKIAKSLPVAMVVEGQSPYFVAHPVTGSAIDGKNRADARKWASKICDETGRETHVIERATGKVKDSYEPD